MTPFADPAVKAHFDAYPPGVRKKMLALRELIFDTAARADGVGELTEALKWGEPAYLTDRSRSGSTVRIDWKRKAPEQYAVYFNCQTRLVDEFRTLFPNDFSFEGNRALVFALDQDLPQDSLALCIEASLRYHLGKRSPQVRS